MLNKIPGTPEVVGSSIAHNILHFYNIRYGTCQNIHHYFLLTANANACSPFSDQFHFIYFLLQRLQ